MSLKLPAEIDFSKPIEVDVGSLLNKGIGAVWEKVEYIGKFDNLGYSGSYGQHFNHVIRTCCGKLFTFSSIGNTFGHGSAIFLRNSDYRINYIAVTVVKESAARLRGLGGSYLFHTYHVTEESLKEPGRSYPPAVGDYFQLDKIVAVAEFKY